MDDLPTIADVRAASDRIRGEAVRTPLVSSPVLDEIVGARVFLKAENLQRTGSFKFRGAFNALKAQEDAAQNGVVACSSGNHAQGVAEAAKILGVPATIVMPIDAPAAKKARTIRSGATVVEYDRYTQDREAIARDIAGQNGALFVHPYEDPYVIAGQGTCGLEIVEDLQAMGLHPDAVLVCTGGGGLLAGIATAVWSTAPDTAMVAVEPEGFDDYARSLSKGERVANEGEARSVCDAILTQMPGRRSFQMVRSGHARSITVTDAEALAAVAFAARELKLVLEPGGAVALAALLKGKSEGMVAGRTLVATLSGGNVDGEMFARSLLDESSIQ